jgi:hypothetical protein
MPRRVRPRMLLPRRFCQKKCRWRMRTTRSLQRYVATCINFVLLDLHTFCVDVPQCMENEEFTECGWLCQPTCNNNVPQNCSDGCVETCVCKKGYIRSAVDGPCVPQDSCSQGKRCFQFCFLYSKLEFQ